MTKTPHPRIRRRAQPARILVDLGPRHRQGAMSGHSRHPPPRHRPQRTSAVRPTHRRTRRTCSASSANVPLKVRTALSSRRAAAAVAAAAAAARAPVRYVSRAPVTTDAVPHDDSRTAHCRAMGTDSSTFLVDGNPADSARTPIADAEGVVRGSGGTMLSRFLPRLRAVASQPRRDTHAVSDDLRCVTQLALDARDRHRTVALTLRSARRSSRPDTTARSTTCPRDVGATRQHRSGTPAGVAVDDACGHDHTRRAMWRSTSAGSPRGTRPRWPPRSSPTPARAWSTQAATSPCAAHRPSGTWTIGVETRGRRADPRRCHDGGRRHVGPGSSQTGSSDGDGCSHHIIDPATDAAVPEATSCGSPWWRPNAVEAEAHATALFHGRQPPTRSTRPRRSA